MFEIQTHDGQFYNYKNPETFDFEIETIAHALSHVCRFGGHCEKFYSVAQHSVLASLIVPRQCALQALMHDATEAFLVDIPSPLKALLPEYKRLERQLSDTIMTRFGLPRNLNSYVKDADIRLLATERRDMICPSGPCPQWAFIDRVTCLEFKIVPWTSERAKKAFIDRFDELSA